MKLIDRQRIDATLGPSQDALDKIEERRRDFDAAGWSEHDLFHLGSKPYHRQGLVWNLQPHQDLGPIFPHVVVILGRLSGLGERSRTLWWRKEFHELCRELGRENVVPRELEWRPKERLRSEGKTVYTAP